MAYRRACDGLGGALSGLNTCSSHDIDVRFFLSIQPELESEDEDDGTGRMPGEFPPGSPSSHDAGQPPLPPGPEEVPLLPPGGGFGHIFRYGFAARGLMRGGAMGARGRGLGRGGLNAHAPDGHN